MNWVGVLNINVNNIVFKKKSLKLKRYITKKLKILTWHHCGQPHVWGSVTTF